MLKILQARRQWNKIKNFQMYKLGLEKAEEPETKLPTFVGPQSQGIPEETSTSASLNKNCEYS